MTTLTLDNVRNLKALAEWLIEHEAELLRHTANDDPVFTMLLYSDDALVESSPTPDDIDVLCGSQGCAIGWATHAVEPRIVERFGNRYHPEPWGAFARRLFGCSDQEDGIGTFMFGYRWAEWPEEDTPTAAARRILAVLASALTTSTHHAHIPPAWPHWNYEHGCVEYPAELVVADD